MPFLGGVDLLYGFCYRLCKHMNNMLNYRSYCESEFLRGRTLLTLYFKRRVWDFPRHLTFGQSFQGARDQAIRGTVASSPAGDAGSTAGTQTSDSTWSFCSSVFFSGSFSCLFGGKCQTCPFFWLCFLFADVYKMLVLSRCSTGTTWRTDM